MPQLALSLLGLVQIALDDQPLTGFESDKARALLIYLALHAGLPYRREALGALFWERQDKRHALQNLRKTLHRLRQTVGDHNTASQPFLLVTPQTVEFNTESDYELDVRAFCTLIAETRRHRHRHRETCRACMERLRQAVALYRGDFLAGFTAKDSIAFEEWVAIQRERLHAQALEALHLLATYHERRGEYELACEYARRQLELEPWLEMAHRQLMRILAYSGRRTTALVQYDICRQILARELGVEPEAETTRLYERIRDGDQRTKNQVRPASLCRNFPAPITPFVGRDAELAQIGEALQNPDCRLLTLVGPGGSGKTRLAVVSAIAEADAFQDGACFVALAHLTAGDLAVRAIAEALDMRLSPDEDLRGEVLAFLRDKEMLLVLDNFEHIMPAALLVSELLQTCPRLTILVTSREALHLYGEQEIPVKPLRTPGLLRGAKDRQAVVLARFPAVQFFVQRLQAICPDFRLSDENAAVIGEICDRLDGLPLAIELAAACARSCPPHEMLMRLRQSLALLPAGARDLPARQRTLWETMEWSHRLLTPQEQILFRRLAVFAGPFTLAMAEATCNADKALGPDITHTLAALVDKNLVRLVTTEDGAYDGRSTLNYEMLETIRAYAWERLKAAGEVQTACRWHLALFGHEAGSYCATFNVGNA